MIYVNYNSNPMRRKVGDCTVRAISKALEQSWEHTYIELAVQGLLMYDMPSANAVWGEYLNSKGFVKKAINKDKYYTIVDFCRENPIGTYIVGTGSHTVCIEDGKYYDTWDSGDETPIFYFAKKE